MSIAELYQKFKASNGVSTDTRKIDEGVMFFALKGEKFNANTFAQEALNKGASYVVIDEAEYVIDERCILVGDVLYTLQKLANYHRQQLNIPFVGMTGSNGKTTSKELVAAVLSKKYKTYSTKGNYNNHIGVPLTVLGIDDSYEIAVIEMGANHQGEIRDLCTICEPTHGFITNVGKAHLEGFGGVEGVKKGKGELYDFLAKSGGTVFVNNNSESLLTMASQRKFKERIDYLNNDEVKLLQDSPVAVFSVNGVSYDSHLPGAYNFDNIATALAVGKYFGVPAELANQAAAEYNPDNNRSQIVEKGSNSILLDAYNANPSSMSASIQNFINLQTSKKKVVILGDMFELGEEGPAEHRMIGELVAKGNFDLVVLFGELMTNALEFLPNAFYFSDKFSLHNWLIDKQLKDSYVLIKGSRGVSLETVVQFL
ncbi:UDP-N-acetylmuramoylalanyl-D-glutamyl-2,6-diamin opimelate/D-alanyl-D-alanylligase [Emticicia oligotrophica DSM 17448]|uniref:UDP-N-acetylmuramoyl-tripeptide--D-alanyl-D-alanine ligase n=1 Tax=Emticicia oligotrophica (strain DSM 17448 / CIP 109782 / MTCC 6937 / GPTSA100-15) TaxID=929562 RepID=A0ABM5N1M3_EMTOG|nr:MULTISPECIES: UDP-N-acetylmuramoyl-tripeptide--D-alanyl-D-alanine ligase [Emticicia]AFK03238.1 UDP-N-acetylmuramoylalanyl-D-glutamyl-2,6-diamin opimelate/D-alanyl-D-alanylligase [Emticicia oligotrophica DSM 17448]